MLLYCHAGCPPEVIVDALGLQMKDLFAESLATPVASAGNNGKRKRRIVATYRYHDADGTLLYETVRFEPKGFAQRRPDGKGGWIWDRAGTKQVPYQLRKLLAAKATLVVEGERDVATADNLSLVATCNPGGVDNGTGSKFPKEFGQYFTGKSVGVNAILS